MKIDFNIFTNYNRKHIMNKVIVSKIAHASEFFGNSASGKMSVVKSDNAVISDDPSPTPPLPKEDNIDISCLSREQRQAYDKFVNGENVFVTGPGGTGKTKLVQNFLQYAQTNDKKIQICALTGCAAVLLGCKARTIHSWSGIKLARGSKEQVITSVLKNKNAVRDWKEAKCLILDEVSMLSQKIFEILEEIGRRARRNTSVFGGLQVIFLGDFFQLPPIETENDPGTEKFCFESPVWGRVFSLENHIQLTHIFRQKDANYINILMQVRKGYLDRENVEVLESYVNREYDPSANNGCIPAKLFAIRSKVDFINKQMFAKLDEKEFANEAIEKTDCKLMLDTGKAISADLLYKCSLLTLEQKTYEIENLLNNSACSKIYRFKKGASVMCTVNLDMDNQICNGAQGIITDIIEEGPQPTIVVKFSNGIIKRIVPYYWQSEEFPAVAVGQYPLILAWALTIHKIQGATLKLAEIDIGSSIFEYGQTYVALSRIQSLDGLYLSAFHPQKIRANPIVIQFYEKISV
jgi:ATP-dependent DNA helicase PIF1